MTRSNEAALRLFLDRLTNRSVLTQEEEHAILTLPTHRIEVRARQDFVYINEETSYSCLVASGLVARFGQLRDGVRQTTAFHIAGDMADLHSAVRPIGVGGLHAVADAVILRLPHDALRGLAARFPAIGEAMWRDCMLDAAILMQWVVNVGQRDALTRLAHLVCEMAVRSGGNREPMLEFDFPVTQEQLGEAVALTGVHVNRSLKRLRELGVFTLRGGKVKIADWDKLANLGEFDDAYLVADTRPERQKRLLAAA